MPHHGFTDHPLTSDDFVAEVRKRSGQAAGVLSPAGLKALRDGFAEQAGVAAPYSPLFRSTNSGLSQCRMSRSATLP